MPCLSIIRPMERAEMPKMLAAASLFHPFFFRVEESWLALMVSMYHACYLQTAGAKALLVMVRVALGVQAFDFCGDLVALRAVEGGGLAEAQLGEFGGIGIGLLHFVRICCKYKK